MKKSLLLFLIIVSFSSFAQRLSVSGNVQDTTIKEPLPNAVVMVIKLMDSTLVDFTRTNKEGFFNLKSLPIDTYQVIISHPKFTDQGYFIFGDSKNLKYDFGKIILQPKNVSLDEVTIFAFKDPVYYKGDTLVYTADSFKTKANATVEDLLKKLPGIKVDATGRIISQGKQIDKVLVDGDEFFGTDPTVATKNLSANAIESVQVYEKKSEDDANSSTGEETQKILNLKLKEDAKKGYFGRVSVASDFQKFYEGEVLGNYFKKKLKTSIIGLASNTPRSDFGFDDLYKYGVTSDFEQNDEGTYYFKGNTNEGIPQTLKSGIYFSDQLGKNTKLNINYSYNRKEVLTKTSTTSQYFLEDTSYTTSNVSQAVQTNEAHAINLGIEQKIDSLTDVKLSSRIKLLGNKTNSSEETDFIRSDNIKSRNTSISNANQGNGYDLNTNVKLNRRFMKKDRLLSLTYSNALSSNSTNGILKTDNFFYSDSTSQLNTVNQKKFNLIDNQNHNGGVVFLEPITKKIKIETTYDFMYYNTKQDKKSLNNINGDYTAIDSSLTNNFLNRKQINRVGLKFIYEVKKMRYTIGARARNVYVDNNNLFNNQRITQNFNNILPYSTLRYKFSDNMMMNIGYYTSSNNPTINQLQPIRDNTNPNFINIGNPNLLPTFSHHVDFNFNSWKSISGKYLWLGVNYMHTNNDIINSTVFDSIGRTVSKPINVNGNYSLNGYVGYNIPFFSKQLSLQPNANGNYSSSKNYINNIENTTENIQSNIGLEIDVNLENFSAGVSGYMEFNSSSSSLNNESNKPYTTQGLTGDMNWKLPKKFFFETDATYTINSNRSDGYNINFLVWNTSLSKAFLKNENLLLGIYAYDILNQNINVNRNINSNVITDTKTNVVTQYFLGKITFKFNSNKTKEEDEED